MLQFLYRIQPTRAAMLTSGPTEGEVSAISEHFSYLENLAERGVVLLAGRTMTTDEGTFGILVFAAESEGEAVEIVRRDPAIERGVMNFELFPYRVAVLSRNWVGAA